MMFSLLLILKLGKDTKDITSPLLTSISRAPPPGELKVTRALFNSSSIICWIFVSTVNFNGLFNNLLSFNSASKYFSTPEIP